VWATEAERRAFIESDGSVDDVLTLSVTNTGATQQDLDGLYLPFYATDANEDRVIAVSDGLAGTPGWQADVLEGRFTVVVHLRGALGWEQTRMVGVHLCRRGRAALWPERIHFADPFLLRESFTRAEGTVVFPNSEHRRLVAQDATVRTSRTATWVLDVPTVGPQQMVAYCEAGQVSVAVRRLDDGLALAHRAAALTSTGEGAPIQAAQRTLLEALTATEASGWELDQARVAVGALAACETLSAVPRYERLRRAIKACLDARELVRRARPVMVSSSQVEPVLLYLLQQIDLQREEADLRTPRPDDLEVSLRYLLDFAAWWRRDGVRDWRSGMRETDFQRQLRHYLGIRVDDPDTLMRELPIERGRVDFLLIDTPVELKAVLLTGGRTEPYLQQVAAYVAARGSSVGVLMVLDTTDRSAERTHLPPLGDQVSVKLVPAVASAGKPTEPTLLVVLILDALPPHPSDLR